jgi:hypothetical protein
MAHRARVKTGQIDNALQKLAPGVCSSPPEKGKNFGQNFKNSIDDVRWWSMLTIPVEVKAERAKVLAGADLAGSRR